MMGRGTALLNPLPSMRRKYVPFVLFLASLSLTSGCASVFIAGGPSLDSGTIEVGGLESSVGAQMEVGFQNERKGTGLGGYLSLELVGYRSDGDGDPILHSALEGRYRRLWGLESQTLRPFYALGAGGGVVSVLAGSLAPGAGSITLHGEVGGQYSSGRTVVSLSLRERPSLLVSRSVEFLNSLQVSLGVGFGVGG